MEDNNLMPNENVIQVVNEVIPVSQDKTYANQSTDSSFPELEDNNLMPNENAIQVVNEVISMSQDETYANQPTAQSFPEPIPVQTDEKSNNSPVSPDNQLVNLSDNELALDTKDHPRNNQAPIWQSNESDCIKIHLFTLRTNSFIIWRRGDG